MAKNEQSRKYLLTINNPADCGLTHDKIKALVQSLSPAYFCMADEIASTGTHHTHVFLYRPSPVRWHTVKTCSQPRILIRHTEAHRKTATIFKKAANGQIPKKPKRLYPIALRSSGTCRCRRARKPPK